MNKLFALITVIITLVHATPAHAMGPVHRINFVSYTAGCTPYTHGMVLQSYANVLNHASCGGVAVKDNTGKAITPAKPVITVETVETTQATQEVETVEVVPAPVENPAPVVQDDKKAKCNNGEGNEAEGCSPANSDNANNDENNTSPKEDKSKK